LIALTFSLIEHETVRANFEEWWKSAGAEQHRLDTNEM
jgi:hypothetical protein